MKVAYQKQKKKTNLSPLICSLSLSGRRYVFYVFRSLLPDDWEEFYNPSNFSPAQHVEITQSVDYSGRTEAVFLSF